MCLVLIVYLECPTWSLCGACPSFPWAPGYMHRGGVRVPMLDPLYHSGSLFTLERSLNVGPPQPKNVGMSMMLQNMTFCILRPRGYSSGCDLSFAEVSDQVTYGTLQVRSLRIKTVHLYCCSMGRCHGTKTRCEPSKSVV